MSLPLLRFGSLSLTSSPLASTSRVLLLSSRPLSLSSPSLVYPTIHPAQPDPETFDYNEHLVALQAARARPSQKAIKKREQLAIENGQDLKELEEEKAKLKKLTKDKISFSNLPHGLTHLALKAILEAKGLSVGSVRIMVYPRSDGRFVSRGYGWATLTDPGHVKKGMKAALELDGLVIDERPINVEIGHAKTHNLFFSPLRKASRKASRLAARSNPINLPIPVPGQWAYRKNQHLLLSSPSPSPSLPLIGSPSSSSYDLRTQLLPRTEGGSGKKRKETGAAGRKHMRRFLPGEVRPEVGVDGYGLRRSESGLDEIPSMALVGGERKWTKKRIGEARRDGWGNGPEGEEKE